MNIKKHIPNLITLINLFCGCVAIVFVSQGDYLMAFYMVCLGIFFDFFDGFFARLFKVSSPLGLQLDSLADMVTSGVTPGYVMYSMFANSGHELGTSPAIPFLGFIVTLGSCYRLANFNIDTRQTDSFIGLPTPANALFILSLPLVISFSDSLMILEILTNQWVLLLITLCSAYILNAEIPLFSLKIKKFSLKENALQIVFLTISVLLVVLLHYIAIPLIIVFYVVLSIINNLFLKK
ncbi:MULTISPECIES: CDP-alcohol phosphatidyltransferase family protein [unclassified Flavobacterium]|jgi:CDP-diacylglycerol--serine O-phosphatidyltransferase|uniref:CDP-alcohol phosphatidyltransferase family protein n=1 Tax=unclassified Flavobacterium TaxID=196869 RepID=UPI002490D89C|nr:MULTISPECIES: CDP-alcohol phosphatidyltransferase family protein [unclassified Flavobacterium]MDQ1167470.1 CDP-diacylglycerol--serine O-phosphatidyltransferase [Flavobacterium sp. SORGH_AS_0622]BDU23530.1 phosphatidylserine synthase [Flavobacterium sp. GSB-24]